MILGYILLALTAIWLTVIIVLNLIPFFRIENLWRKIITWDFPGDEIGIVKRAAYVTALVVFIAAVVIIAVNA